MAKKDVDIELREKVKNGEAPIDVLAIREMIIEREEAKSNAKRHETMFKTTIQTLFMVCPSGIPITCSNCRFEGFTVDFLAVGIKQCPNCKETGYVNVKACSPVKGTVSLETAMQNMRTVNEWFQSLEDKPALPNQALAGAIDSFRSAGLFK